MGVNYRHIVTVGIDLKSLEISLEPPETRDMTDAELDIVENHYDFLYSTYGEKNQYSEFIWIKDNYGSKYEIFGTRIFVSADGRWETSSIPMTDLSNVDIQEETKFLKRELLKLIPEHKTKIKSADARLLIFTHHS